jgi:hypothetical protein
MFKICNECGQELPPNATECNLCGEQLNKKIEASNPPPPKRPTPPAPQPSPTPPLKRPSQKTVAILITAVILAGVIGFWLHSRTPNTPEGVALAFVNALFNSDAETALNLMAGGNETLAITMREENLTRREALDIMQHGMARSFEDIGNAFRAVGGRVYVNYHLEITGQNRDRVLNELNRSARHEPEAEILLAVYSRISRVYRVGIGMSLMGQENTIPLHVGLINGKWYVLDV